MKDLFANRFKSAKACLAIAKDDEHRAVWENQAPEAFGEEVAELDTDCAAIEDLDARARQAAKGEADAKDADETTLEQACHKTSRALASHFKKTEDLANLAKVDFKLGYYQKLTDPSLISAATGLITIATAAKDQPGASKRGVTPALIAALQTALDAFTGTDTTPRAGIVKRSTLLRELAAKLETTTERLDDMDDLVLQFDTTAAGRRLIAAWNQARIILAAGHAPGEEEENPLPQPPAPPAP